MAGDDKPGRKWLSFFTTSTPPRSASSPVSAPTMSLIPPSLRMTPVNKDKEKENNQPGPGNPPPSSTNMTRSPSASAPATPAPLQNNSQPPSNGGPLTPVQSRELPAASGQQGDPHPPGVGAIINRPARIGDAPRLRTRFENDNNNKKLTPKQQRYRDDSVQASLESEYEVERLARAGVDTRDFQTETDAKMDAEARERMRSAESADNRETSSSLKLAGGDEEAVDDSEQPSSSHVEDRKSDWEAMLRRRLQAEQAAQRSRQRERMAAVRAEQIDRAMDTAQRQAQELARELAEDDYDENLFEN